MVCAQVVKNESKRKLRHPYVSITRGMESSLDVRLVYNVSYPE
jgi:hypothetical protein